MIQAILFDLDGVLLDSMPWHVKAWKKTFAERGFRVEEEFVYLHEGAIERSGLLEILTAQGLPKAADVMDHLFVRQAEIFSRDYSAKVSLYSEAYSVLDKLTEAGLRLALVTSSSGPTVSRSVPSALLEKFEAVVTGDEVVRGKPDPEPYLTALSLLDLPAQAGRAVENAPAGIRSARSAGLVCYGLTTTLTAEQLSQADAIFPSLNQLAGYILAGPTRFS